MTIVCKMPQCPFWDKNGFCGKGVIKVDENGMCSTLWKRGQRKMLETPFTEERYPKRLMKIVEAEEYTREEDRKEEAAAGTNPEDSTNGAAAS